MLFDSDRWGRCDEAIVAEEDGQILGIVTFAWKGAAGRPTIDTLYVPKRHRNNGLGSTLFERGIRRLAERGVADEVFCQLQSSVMLRLVEKLPEDLRTRLRVEQTFQFGDLAEDFDDYEQGLAE